MKKRRRDIADFRASDGLNPIVMQKLNTNFWNLLDMFQDPEIVMVASVSEPTPRTDESLWYKTDTGALYIWSDMGEDGWKWVNASEVVLDSAEAAQIIGDAVDDYCDGRFATIASPSFTGTPTAPTASSGTSSTQIATTAFVSAAIAAAIASPFSYQGVILSQADLGTSYLKGYCWLVGAVSQGTQIAGETVSEGDTAVANSNYSGDVAADIDIIHRA